MKKEIRICENCRTPLIWTFRWDYNERYCMNCGALGDMFLGKDVPLTHELKIEKAIVDGIWKVLYGNNKPLLPRSGGYRKDKCEKCDKGESHHKHLSKNEIIDNKIAEIVLDNMEMLFDKKCNEKS